jgi:Carboxypeptidase regulatory-like domain
MKNKKNSLFIVAMSIVFANLFLVNAFASDKNDLKLAIKIKSLTDRSAEGLVQKVAKDGGVSVDLQGRFQNVMLSKIGVDGEPDVACVTSLDEANSFFERNLETGQPIYSTIFKNDAIKILAARHGMSAEEFTFYTKLIEDAAVQRALSPNAATINIVNNDGAGEGFNDATAATAEGGNSGTTRGQQRLNLFNFAAGIWGAFLDSNVPINVRSQFDPLTPCSSSGGVLGSAGTLNVHRDFANAGFAGTWHHAALANKENGTDLASANPEINATFNSDVDNACLGAGTRFYYGLDNATPTQRINLLVVLLHEMGHGLGFSSFANGSTGVLFNGFPDVYTRFMFDRSISKYWYLMTDAERATSALNTGNVLWDGASVKIASGNLTAGRDAATGRVQLFNPNPFQGGSSVSHFDSAVSPNLLMEPAINVGLPIDLDLTRQQMRDIGWYRDTTADLVPDTISGVSPNSSAVTIGQVHPISWTNTGGFTRNVRIELSTDGGATFPTVIASSVANSFVGSFAPTATFSWTVPNTPTTQARIRVREADFASPVAASSGNFTIGLAPTAASASIAGKVLNASGRGVSRVRVTITDSSGAIRYSMTNSFGNYRFDNLEVGQNYILSVSSKRYQFANATQTIFVGDDLTGVDFTALP